MLASGSPHILLLAATLALLTTAWALRTLRAWPLWLLLLIRVCTFTAVTFLLYATVGSPFHPRFSPAAGGMNFWEHVVEGCWWLLGATLGINLVRLFVVLEHRPRETQIMSDLLAGAISVTALLGIVNFVLGVPIAGLLATSGVIAIVLGLAMQNTLADVFSGIAVGLERPYKAGDLLWVEGDIEGAVAQVTWRSTHIATAPGNIAIVPNSVMAKAKLINRSLPMPTRCGTIELKLDPAVPPEHCLAVLSAAARAALSPLQTPPPSVTCTDIKPDGLFYSLSYMVASSAELGSARSELLTLVHRHLRVFGIGFYSSAGPTRPAPGTPPTPEALLAESDLFKILDPAQRAELAGRFEPVDLDPHTALFLEGCIPDHLFLIVSGVVEIEAPQSAAQPLTPRLGAGDSVGATGLLTGCVYPGTARALTPVHAYRLSRNALSDFMAQVPALAEHFSAALSNRNAPWVGFDGPTFPPRPGHKADLAARLRSLFHSLIR